MTSLRIAAASIVLASVTLTGAHTQQSDDYCATTPPPKGLVARCQSLTLTVPASEDALRAALTDWMRTCVSKSRAAGLIDDADDNVVDMWDRMKDLPRSRSLTIIPDYEPLTFTRNGQTCYGVESVEFSIKGSRGEVIDEPFDVTPVPSRDLITDPTDEEIKEAATAATAALLDSEVSDNSGLPKFRGVLDGMARYGKDFDDRWFNVGDESCYRASSGGCRPVDEAVKLCTRRLRVDIVTHYQQLKDRPERFTEAMEETNSRLFRAFQYFRQAQDGGSGRGHCNSVKSMMTVVSELARKGQRALYYYY